MVTEEFSEKVAQACLAVSPSELAEKILEKQSDMAKELAEIDREEKNADVSRIKT